MQHYCIHTVAKTYACRHFQTVLCMRVATPVMCTLLRNPHFKGALNLHEVYKFRQLCMKSLHILFVFGSFPLSASENTAKVIVCVFWLFENL